MNTSFRDLLTRERAAAIADFHAVRELARHVRIGLVIFGIAAGLAILAHTLYAGGFTGAVVVTALKVTPILLLWSWYSHRNNVLRRALLCGAFGDIALGPLFDSMPVGMIAFAIGHFVYSGVLWRQTRVRRAWLGIPFALIAIGQGLVFADVAPGMRVGLVVYGLILAWMAASAATASWIAFAGAVLFAFSDSLISLHTFVVPVPAYYVFMLSTYYAAQLLILLGGLTARPEQVEF